MIAGMKKFDSRINLAGVIFSYYDVFLLAVDLFNCTALCGLDDPVDLAETRGARPHGRAQDQ